MLPEISLCTKYADHNDMPGAIFIKANSIPQNLDFKDYLNRELRNGQTWVEINPQSHIQLYSGIKPDATPEDFRRVGAELAHISQNRRFDALNIDASILDHKELNFFLEGFLLATYRFLNYLRNDEALKKAFPVNKVIIAHKQFKQNDLKKLTELIKVVFWTRDQVNEPANILTTNKFVKRLSLLAEQSNVAVEIYDKKKIESLGMGGLLAVNQGSALEPAFVIFNWKPEKAINNKPIVLVGKGITYDTGGLSLKPTASMDTMKNDMAGAATVASVVALFARNNVPVWTIALMPITDNRLQATSYAPGDVIQMHNGLFVEVMNTDAEGRLILADAISFAEKFDPTLVINIATLTGSAQAATGMFASVCMGNAPEIYFNQLIEAGNKTHERLARFPFYDDYAESLKSDIADLKNIGGKEAGAITAGKFLEKFCKAPFIHIDIAGTAYSTTNGGYKPKGATGTGVRLFTEFIENISIEPDKN